MGDKGKLKQVLLNLAINALQAVPNGGKIFFRTFEDDRFCIIEVEDIGGGIDETFVTALPEASSVNFAPRIGAPTLLLNGRYDEEHPWISRGLPLWRLLREPKQLTIVDGGHLPRAEARVPVINEWLDETLGPVR